MLSQQFPLKKKDLVMSGAKPTGGPERPKEEVEQVPALYKEGGMAGIQHSMLPVGC